MSMSNLTLGKVSDVPIPLVADFGEQKTGWWKSLVRCKECTKEKGRMIYFNTNGKILVCRYSQKEEII